MVCIKWFHCNMEKMRKRESVSKRKTQISLGREATVSLPCLKIVSYGKQPYLTLTVFHSTGSSQLYVGLRSWKSCVNREPCKKRISFECTRKLCITDFCIINRTIFAWADPKIVYNWIMCHKPNSFLNIYHFSKMCITEAMQNETCITENSLLVRNDS